MDNDTYRALYIHVPFCRKRCAYCDFSTCAVQADDPRIAAYSEDMVLAIRRAGKQGLLGSLDTVYIGGGTPSFIGQKYLGQILYTLGLSTYLTAEMEVSMEANPDSITEPLIRDIWALGVNRLSIGVQSFDDAVLKTLGRLHNAAQAQSAVKTAQTRFENVSIDLMCGIPGQSIDSFRTDVSRAIDLGVTHISVYPLTIEEGTPLDAAVDSGRLPDVDEDTQAAFMLAAQELLDASGFHRYEVASYARDGFECRHNKAYWTGVPYLGLGPSAVTMTRNGIGRVRTCDGEVQDRLDVSQGYAEDLMLGMRMTCGVSDEFIEQSKAHLAGVTECFARLVDEGFVVHVDGRMRPTERGWLCGNLLYGPLLQLAP